MEILRSIAQKLVRGYSDTELAEKRRLADGNITAEDRQRFIQDKEASARFALSMVTGLRNPGEQSDYYQALPPLGHRKFFEGVDELRGLPEAELNQRIRQSAANDLTRWHQAI